MDALGLGGQADRIADRLLPGLSVVTRRARYLSFFCWAVREVEGQRTQIAGIHRLEAELACEEAQRHVDNDPAVCPDIVGRRSARRYLDENGRFPTRPEGLYKSMAFAAYRPLMRDLGLLAGGRRPELTGEGDHLASLYQRHGGPKPRCLSDVSSAERTWIRRLLGLDFRARDPANVHAVRRRETFVEVSRSLARNMPAAAVLETYSSLGSRPTVIAETLHKAFAWETLSLGLTLAFAMLLTEGSLTPVARRLRQALVGSSRWPGLQVFDPLHEAAARQVWSLLRQAHELGIPDLGLDPYPSALAERLVVDREVNRFLEQLIARHHQVKLGEAWVRAEGRKLRVLRPKKNLELEPKPRSYRLDAFAQLVRDLGMLR